MIFILILLVFTALWARGVDFHWYLQHFGHVVLIFTGIYSTLERKPSYSLLFAALWKGVFHISRYLQHFLSTRIKIHDICMEISKIEM